MNPWKLRADLVATARALKAHGLAPGTSGNVSVRHERGFLITPSGVPYDALSAGDAVQLDAAGRVVGGHLSPSSEWRLHHGLYQSRPDFLAIVHAHPRHATALACTRRDIPPFHYMVAIAGGDSIRCAPYAPFGSDELAHAAAEAISERRACLLANHGALTAGSSLEGALDLMVELEELAGQYATALQIGSVAVLTREEMADVLERFKNYGQR